MTHCVCFCLLLSLLNRITGHFRLPSILYHGAYVDSAKEWAMQFPENTGSKKDDSVVLRFIM